MEGEVLLENNVNVVRRGTMLAEVVAKLFQPMKMTLMLNCSCKIEGHTLSTDDAFYWHDDQGSILFLLQVQRKQQQSCIYNLPLLATKFWLN